MRSGTNHSSFSLVALCALGDRVSQPSPVRLNESICRPGWEVLWSFLELGEMRAGTQLEESAFTKDSRPLRKMVILWLVPFSYLETRKLKEELGDFLHLPAT